MSEARIRPEFMKALEDFDAQVGTELKPRLRDMLRLRVSHLNGCAFSIRLHSEALTALGVRPEVISALARPVHAMRDGLVSEGDAAALRLAEVLTDAPRSLEASAREAAAPYFTRVQLGAIIETVALTHAWNRVMRGVE
ncbi:carboxymuconolactone decarboxylase family protein [Demequina sp. NBRC 110055]|uniref:carboxymuconolactone decarboxylase family protein n=1 Tax=Demequina sp. NBRC 110055 TaxID=1570344 RepID=UPI00135670C0|nr:carboxymuconolactone decarboxylase family protein [Demequina sp. NBRC 110055]